MKIQIPSTQPDAHRAELFAHLCELYQQYPRRRTIFAFLRAVAQEHRGWLWARAEKELLREAA